MFFVWRDGQEQAVAIVHACTPMMLPHELPYRLRAAEMLCHEAHPLRQHPLCFRKALRPMKFGGIAIDGLFDVADTNMSIPQFLAQLLHHVSVLLR